MHVDKVEYINDLLLVDWKGIIALSCDDVNTIVEQ